MVTMDKCLLILFCCSWIVDGGHGKGILLSKNITGPFIGHNIFLTQFLLNSFLSENNNSCNYSS